MIVLAACLLPLPLAAAPPPQDEQLLFRIQGSPTVQVGHGEGPTGGVGDLDGDGHAEFAVAEVDAGFQAITRILSGRTGLQLFQVFGFGSRPAGDVNADGTPDFLVSGVLYSGRTGTFLRSTLELEALGDVDGDGYDDLYGGDPEASVSCAGGKLTISTYGAGFVRVTSGRDGATLFQQGGDASGDAFGGLAVPLGDLDGDGVREVLAGALAYGEGHCFAYGAAYLRAYSVVSGLPFWELRGRPDTAVALDDLDGDGAPDFALGYLKSSLVELRSGLTGALLRTLQKTSSDRFGETLQSLADLDADGLRELVVGASQVGIPCIGSCGPGGGQPTGPGYVEVFSSRDDSLLARFDGQQFGEGYGGNVASAGDVNADGVPDLVITALGRDANRGVVEVLSARPLALRSPSHLVSLAQGGVQSLFVDGGTTNAGRLALLLGSASGTRPGLPLGGVLVPLRFDRYTTALFLGTSPLQTSARVIVLDGQGRGFFGLGVPPGLPPALAGETLAHGAVTFDAPALRWLQARFATPAVPLSFVR